MSSNEFDSKKTVGIGKVIFYMLSTIIVLLLGIILFAALMTNSSSKPSDFLGYRFFCMTTDGYAARGDFVVAKVVDITALKAGQDVVYVDGKNEQNNPIITTGRIRSVEMTGDAGVFKISPEDKGRPVTDVVGEVSFAVPMLGSWILFFKTPLGLICCVAIPLFFLLIYEIVNLIKLSKTQEEETPHLEGDLPSYMRMGDEEPIVAKGPVSNSAVEGKPNHDYLFEQQDEQLEVMQRQTPFKPLSYQKPAVSTELAQTKANSLYSTKEFNLSDIKKAAEAAKPAKKPVTQATGSSSSSSSSSSSPKAETEASSQPKPAVEVSVPTVTPPTEFSTSMRTDSDNNFSIEGIGVRVKPDAVQLILDNDVKSRDISITVTKEYTNIVVESGDCEVNFAMIREDGDKEQKVIIQKKAKVIPKN